MPYVNFFPVVMDRSDQSRFVPSDIEDGKLPNLIGMRVKSDGTMRFEGKVYFLSRALAEWDVGLAPVEEVRWEVRFGRLVLGHLEAATEAFLPIVTPSSQEAPKAA